MYWTVIEFPGAKLFLAKTERDLCMVRSLRNDDDFDDVLRRFKEKKIPLIQKKEKFHLEEKLLNKYFQGIREDFNSLSFDFIYGTPYQKRVWLETRKIPWGEKSTYKSIAHNLNHKGYRSVGQALSKNPLLIIIPCHRVIKSDGNLGGFGSWLELKHYLLNLEQKK